MRLVVAAVGRLKDRNLEALCRDYQRRLRASLRLEVREVRRPEDLPRASPEGWERILLAESGRLVDSQSFAKMLEERRQAGLPGLVFWIGGAEGVSEAVAGQADWALSLSPMTFPHRIARLLLLEQLYRAATILSGHPYHK